MIKKNTLVILILFSISVHAFAQHKAYIDIVQKLPENYVKDASVDYTDIIQQAMNRADSIVMPNFPVLINDNGLNVGSNKVIWFQSQSQLKLAPSGKINYALFHIKDEKNVKIYNANLVGDRDIHKNSKGEWGMGMRIEGSRHVLIKNAHISKFWGDGIYITRSNKTNSSQIVVSHSTLDNNRRNGISIISGSDILVKHCAFTNMDGTKPMAGIDIEPNSPKDRLGLIEISNIKTSHNRIGVQVSMMHFPSEKKQTFKINVEDLNSNKDEHGLLIRDFYRVKKYGKKAIPLDGVVTYKDIKIKNSQKEPIKYFNSKKGYEYGPQYIFENIHIHRNRKSLNWMRNTRVKAELKLRGFKVNKF